MPTADAFAPPLLQAGDRMDRDEFMRRWEAMPEVKRAELIDGVVYMGSPVSLGHSRFDAMVSMWLGYYGTATPGCLVAQNGTWLMGADVLQPDCALFLSPEYGGQCRMEGDYPSGAPELVVSRGSRELAVYEKAGVREHLAVQVKERGVVWRVLEDGRFRRIEPDSDGLVRSRAFPGLWLDEAALWRCEGRGMLGAVDRGMESAEYGNMGAVHRAFALMSHGGEP